MTRYAVQSAPTPTLAYSCRGPTVAIGNEATRSDTPLIHRNAEFPTAPASVAAACQSIASNHNATTVGIVANPRSGIAAKLDNMDNVGSVWNTPTVTGSVATVAETLPQSALLRESFSGTSANRSFDESENRQMPRVADKERRKEAFEPYSGYPNAMSEPTSSSTGKASALSQGSAITATLAIRAARSMGMPMPASDA